MIVSALARKVLNETPFTETLQNAWWIERMLQKYNTRGLVLMINKSRQLDFKYIEGYHNLYKWAERKDQISIDGLEWVYELLQKLYSDFPWNLWKSLIEIDPMHMDIFIESVNAYVEKNSIPYILSVYFSKVQEFESKSRELELRRIKIEDKKRNIDVNSDREWKKLRDML